MKKTITSFLILMLLCELKAQTVVADFENFALNSNSYYKDTNNNPFQTTHASFQHEWMMGSSPYWRSGFSYTNYYDSINGTFTNLYGVKALRGFNNSGTYVVAQNNCKISVVPQTTVVGFYYTNTTYVYESIKSGDSFSRKFGDTTGTGSGTTIAQGEYPDYCKVIIKGYKSGVEKANTVEFYLADYRFQSSTQDFVVMDWRYVNTSTLGAVDSIKFEMFSTVSNEWGMLTPGFFGIDNFTIITDNPTGLPSKREVQDLRVFPNPFHNNMFIQNIEQGAAIKILDMAGQVLHEKYADLSQEILQLENLKAGIYFLEIRSSNTNTFKKIVKE